MKIPCNAEERTPDINLARNNPAFFCDIWKKDRWTLIDKAIEEEIDARNEFRVRSILWETDIDDISSWDELVEMLDDIDEYVCNSIKFCTKTNKKKKENNLL